MAKVVNGAIVDDAYATLRRDLDFADGGEDRQYALPEDYTEVDTLEDGQRLDRLVKNGP
jgi:hypothetical protein